MATYVLVHGGGHGGWCYQPVARLLRAQGHDMDDEARAALEALGEGRYWEIDTGHDLMITEPGFVANRLALIAAA